MAISQTINPMVNVPSITNIATFEADVDYTLNTGLQTRADEMNVYATQVNTTANEINALAAAMSLNSTNDTSASSVLIGTGSKTFTVSASKSYVKGMYVVVADTAAPAVNSMFGIVDSYSGTTLVIVVLSIRGSGTYTAWTISQSAADVTADNPAAARTALGSTTVGDAVFIAATPAAARTALGAGAVGDAVFTSATNTAAENAMGVTRSLAASGYRKTGDGLIEQWGTTTGTTNAASAIAVTFPIAFPAAAYTVTAVNGDMSTTLGTVLINALSTTQFNATFVTGAGGVGAGVPVRVNWIAKGI